MQQHTGQHILSQSALRELEAETHAVHLGGERSTVDLGVDGFSTDAAARLEEAANTVVFEDRRIVIRNVREEDAATLGLRRPPKKQGTIRVVKIDGFDLSACGGTHVRMTGEVGVWAEERLAGA